jgi:hypothetical protein
MRFHSLALRVAFAFFWVVYSAQAEHTNQTFSVHGRLCYYNGTPSCRIWIAGTKRLLGVLQSDDEVPAMPDKLHKLMSWDREVFANFVVEPLTHYQPGVMQTIRVISASKIVVTEKDKIVLRKDKL